MSIVVRNFYRIIGHDIFDLMSLLKEMRSFYQKWLVEDISRYVGDDTSALSWELKESTEQGDRTPFNIAGGVVILLQKPDIYLKFFGPEHIDDMVVDYVSVVVTLIGMFELFDLYDDLF